MPPFYIRHIAHFFGSHDQHSTFGGSHMTNIEHLGKSHNQYRTLLESRDEYRTYATCTFPIIAFTFA